MKQSEYDSIIDEQIELMEERKEYYKGSRERDNINIKIMKLQERARELDAIMNATATIGTTNIQKIINP